jgi:hypothetical protein
VCPQRGIIYGNVGRAGVSRTLSFMLMKGAPVKEHSVTLCGGASPRSSLNRIEAAEGMLALVEVPEAACCRTALRRASTRSTARRSAATHARGHRDRPAAPLALAARRHRQRRRRMGVAQFLLRPHRELGAGGRRAQGRGRLPCLGGQHGRRAPDPASARRSRSPTCVPLCALTVLDAGPKRSEDAFRFGTMAIHIRPLYEVGWDRASVVVV